MKGEITIGPRVLAAIAIAMLGLLEATCILTGNDGQYLLPIAASIAGLAGFVGGQQYEKAKPAEPVL